MLVLYIKRIDFIGFMILNEIKIKNVKVKISSFFFKERK